MTRITLMLAVTFLAVRTLLGLAWPSRNEAVAQGSTGTTAATPTVTPAPTPGGPLRIHLTGVVTILRQTPSIALLPRAEKYAGDIEAVDLPEHLPYVKFEPLDFDVTVHNKKVRCLPSVGLCDLSKLRKATVHFEFRGITSGEPTEEPDFSHIADIRKIADNPLLDDTKPDHLASKYAVGFVLPKGVLTGVCDENTRKWSVRTPHGNVTGFFTHTVEMFTDQRQVPRGASIELVEGKVPLLTLTYRSGDTVITIGNSAWESEHFTGNIDPHFLLHYLAIARDDFFSPRLDCEMKGVKFPCPAPRYECRDCKNCRDVEGPRGSNCPPAVY